MATKPTATTKTMTGELVLRVGDVSVVLGKLEIPVTTYMTNGRVTVEGARSHRQARTIVDQVFKKEVTE